MTRASLPLVAMILMVASVASAQDPRYQPNRTIPKEPELVALFITMSTCRFSNTPGFDTTMARAKLLLAKQARARGERLVMSGVSLDWDPRVGTDYLLTRFGDFDEIAAGRNWFNSASIPYIWRSADPQPRTPQIVLVRRAVSAGSVGPSFSPDSVLGRIIGQGRIVSWVAAGVPLDSVHLRRP